MGSPIFALSGKFSVKHDIAGVSHADVGLLPFVITPMGEELIVFQAARMGLLDGIYLDDYLSRKSLFKFASDFNFTADDSIISNHGAYYCSYDNLKVFAKEGPLNFSMYFVLDDASPWVIVKHWLDFQDVFVMFRGRLLSYMDTLELVRDNNSRAYNVLNNQGPTPERILKACVHYEIVPKKRKSRAYLIKKDVL